jgi:hypothetical protein
MADKKKEYSIAERLGETLRQAGGQKPGAVPPLNANITAKGVQDVSGVTALNKVLASIIPGTGPNRAVAGVASDAAGAIGKAFAGSTDAARTYNAAKLNTDSATARSGGSSTVVADSSIKDLPAPVAAALKPETPSKPSGVAEASLPPTITDADMSKYIHSATTQSGDGPIIPRVGESKTQAPATETPAQNDITKSIFNALNVKDDAARGKAVRGAADSGHTFTNADLSSLYGMPTTPTMKADSPENLAIIEKNRQDAADSWDTTLSNLSTMRAKEDAQRAENSGGLMEQWRDAIAQAGIGNSTGGTIKTRDQSDRAIAIMDKLLDAETSRANRRSQAETSAANTAESRRYHDELIKQGQRKAPQTVQGDDGIYAYNPDSGKFEPTGIKNKPKEFKPETNLDEALKISKIITAFETAGADVPASLREQLEAALSGGTESTDGITPEIQSAWEAEMKKRGLNK